MFQPQQELKNGRYQVIKLLGSGGFGITYLAQDAKYNRLIVIKTLNYLRFCELYQSGSDFDEQWDEAQEKFISEAVTLASFDHPHIVKAYPQVFQEEGVWCITMEYVEGKNLLEVLEDRGKVFSEDKALQIIEQIGDAVSYIHSKNYLHRDIKPQNILIREEDNQAILIDFGLSREVDFAESMSLTSALTPSYASPEQFERRANFTPAVDVYSLAATLYILVAVPKSPFTPLPNPFLNAKVMLDMDIAHKPPHELNPHLSKWISDAILKGMALEVNQRPQSVEEWLILFSSGKNLETFEFEVVTVDSKGEIVRQETHQAQYYKEILPGDIELEMVAIPEGEFLMGKDKKTFIKEREKLYERYKHQEKFNEKWFGWLRLGMPQHHVTVSSFYMSKYPITQAQWQAITNLPKVEHALDESDWIRRKSKQGDKYPVCYISWNEAVEFCTRLSKATGNNYYLPSETQWEYACRAGTTTPFYFGDTLTDQLANYWATETYADEPKGLERNQVTLVDSFPPNTFGLYDMHGNVWEWCADWWHKNYYNAPSDSRVWSEDKHGNENFRCLRGGSKSFSPAACSSASRFYSNADEIESNLRRSLKNENSGYIYSPCVGLRVVCIDPVIL